MYERDSRRLARLDADLDHDGRIERRTYISANAPVRSEVDADGDGRVERWEYLDARGELAIVGSATANDGREDTWTHAVSADGLRLVEHSRSRDRRIDRREYYSGERLVRAEEDNNADGQIEKWEVFDDAGRLRELRLDTSLKRGRPDRLVRYTTEQRVVAIETDDDGDGVYTALPLATLQPK